MNFLQNLLSKAGGFIGNLFSSPQRQQVISPLPDYNSRTTLPQGFVDPILPPSQPAQRQTQQSSQQFTSSSGGGGASNGQTTNFGMPGELMGALRDVNGVTWQHQGNDQWIALRQTGGGNGADDLVSAFVNPISEALDKWRSKLEDFDKNNPFAFDEAQARASAEERLNPFYDAELNDFLTGIRRASSRSLEDQNRTIGELNVDAGKLSERERFSTQEAIRKSEEGFAGAGLFFSGARERSTGVGEVQGEQTQQDIQSALGRDIGSAQRLNTRTQEDLALREAREKRLLESNRTTSLETDIAGQKKEAAYRRGLERLQFAGDIPGTNAIDKLNLENQFFNNI